MATTTTETAWKIGDRFTYTGDPHSDCVVHSVTRGVTGTIVEPLGEPRRWYVEYDLGPHWKGQESIRAGHLWVSERNITKLEEPAAETERPAVFVFSTDVAAERDKVVAELATFKATVVRVARDLAAEYDWCSVVDEALRIMGLEAEMKTTTQVRADIRIELDVTHDGIEPSEGDVTEAVNALDITGFDYVDSWYSK